MEKWNIQIPWTQLNEPRFQATHVEKIRLQNRNRNNPKIFLL